MLNDVRAYLKKRIEEETGLACYFFRANDDATFPYCVFELDDVTVDDFNRRTFDLTVEFWDKDNPKDIITASDKLSNAWRHWKDTQSTFNCSIYTDRAAGFIEDTDHTIQRISSGYELNVFFKEE